MYCLKLKKCKIKLNSKKFKQQNVLNNGASLCRLLCIHRQMMDDSKRKRRPVVVTPEVHQLRQGANSTTVVLHKIRALWADASVVINSRSALLPSELNSLVRPWPDPAAGEAERALCTYLQRPESHAGSAKVLAKVQQTDRHRQLGEEPRAVRALPLVHLDTTQQAAYAATVEDPRIVASDCEHTTAVCHVLLNWPSIAVAA